ncbi:MAG: alpha/beta family hydrolase [Acidimicrobiia bacterium]
MTLESVYQGPKRGADRAVLLAHGAGADMNAVALTTVADALAAAKIPSLRFNFPYMSAGRGGPDRPPVLAAAVREAAADLAKRAKLPSERLVLGGRSMGGRICSLVVADADDPLPALGLALLGYPLHPPGKPDQLRVEHFPRVRVPCLFVSGTRDAFGTPDELKRHAKKIKGKVSWHWIDTADHGFKPLKASGLTQPAAFAAAAVATAAFVAALPD